MEHITSVTGMVLASSSIGEYDKRLVILTRERGKIAAFAKGAKRPNSPLLGGSQPFSFGTFRLYEGRSSYTVSAMEISNYFMELSSDLESTCYGFYFLELADYYSNENVDESDMLKLLYLSLRALSNPNIGNRLIRRIFELKTFVIYGEYPEVFHCSICKEDKKLIVYSAQRRGAVCESCHTKSVDQISLSESAWYTMQYVIAVELEKLYTFVVTEDVLQEFTMVMNRYLPTVVEKKMKSLEVLENLLKI